MYSKKDRQESASLMNKLFILIGALFKGEALERGCVSALSLAFQKSGVIDRVGTTRFLEIINDRESARQSIRYTLLN